MPESDVPSVIENPLEAAVRKFGEITIVQQADGTVLAYVGVGVDGDPFATGVTAVDAVRRLIEHFHNG